jgi:hypothetical protein
LGNPFEAWDDEMCAKNQILAMVGSIAFVFLFSSAGCAKNATPIIDPPKTTLTEILLTPTEGLKFTSTPEGGMTISPPIVSPYIKVIVADVEIRYLKTTPVQVELVIRGILPDQCKYEFYSIENRENLNIKISLSGIHPADTGCLQTDQNIEYVLPLGRDMPEAERGFSPGDYLLTVNNYETSFSIK